MTARRLALVVVLAALALPAAAVTVTTPSGPAEVFSRANLLDLVALVRLTGAAVDFSPAAGSYVASLAEHEVQFTPGGSLAVVDGALVPLPGPIRTVEGHVIGDTTTAVALLSPFGWTLRGPPEMLQLVRVPGGQRVELSVVDSPSGTLLVIRGAEQKPRITTAPDRVNLVFPSPVQMAQTITPQAGVLDAEVRGNTISLRLAPGVEIVSTYALSDPPRYVLRLGRNAPVAAAAPQPTGPVVVLDPGHGGDDHGAQGPGGELEKDITLAVARLTAARLQRLGITARLTRDDDEGVALTDRTALANRLHADAFVSIHVNASPARGARGAETYFMNADASDVQAAQAAARENAGATRDTLQLILWDLAYVANLNASSRLARDIQEHLNALHGIADRGVKQAPFVVLTGATMPAALVEVGFLSNPDEAARLATPATQGAIATALADAVNAFIRTPEPTAPPQP